MLKHSQHKCTHMFAQRKTKLLQMQRQQDCSTATQLHDLGFLSGPTLLLLLLLLLLWFESFYFLLSQWAGGGDGRTKPRRWGNSKLGFFSCHFFFELLWLMKTFLHVKLKPLRETHRSGTIVHLLQLQQVTAHRCTGAQQNNKKLHFIIFFCVLKVNWIKSKVLWGFNYAEFVATLLWIIFNWHSTHMLQNQNTSVKI